jgi:hypothetical protein
MCTNSTSSSSWLFRSDVKVVLLCIVLLSSPRLLEFSAAPKVLVDVLLLLLPYWLR